MPKPTFHFSTCGAGPHDGAIEDCGRCAARAAWATRNRSYDVRRDVPVGAVVTVTEPVTRRLPIDGDWDNLRTIELQPGVTAFVEGYTNAGFRGIEVSLKLDADGTIVHGISAGVIEPK